MAMIYDLDSEGGAKIFGDGGEDSAGTVQIKGGVATTPALVISRSANGAVTIPAVRIAGSSAASAALIDFGGGFISVTSINFTGIASFTKVVPISLGGVVYGLPAMSLATIGVTAAAF